MRTQTGKKIVSAILAASLLLGSAGTVFAGGGTLPRREGRPGLCGQRISLPLMATTEKTS